LICDCDEFTQAHYRNKYGVTDFTSINVEEPAAPPAQRAPVGAAAAKEVPRRVLAVEG